MVIGLFMDLRIIQPIFFSFAERSKMQIPLWSRMQCTKKACTVIQFSLFFGSLASFCEIEEPFLLYNQGNDPSTR